MHSSRELRSSMFKITVGGRQVRIVDLFDGFGEQDRLGVVISRPCVRIESNLVSEGYEVGMGYDWRVDLEQGADFIGKEALARIKREGPKRKLVGVEIGGEQLGAYNDGSMVDFFPVSEGGSRIGKVTSACFSPRLEKNIGFAMVPTEHAELGTELEVERPEGTTSAVVAPKPFVDPKKTTPKQELTPTAGGRRDTER
jgi:glycine cleavage system aminomethyltransferase T